MSNQPLFRKVLQVGLVVRDLEATAQRYWEQFGIGPWRIHTIDPANTLSMRYRGRPVQHAFRAALANIGELTLELIEPLHGESVYNEHLQRLGEGLHHLAFGVDDYENARQQLQARGCSELQSGRPYDVNDYAYFDTSEALGFVTELNSAEAPGKSFPPPEQTVPPASHSQALTRMANTSVPRAIELLDVQRSHVLLALSNSKPGSDRDFREWYLGHFRRTVLGMKGVLSGQQYEAHEVDISGGKYPGLPYRYLGLYDLSVDGAQDANPIIEQVRTLHDRESSAQQPATWLYFPASERVGRAPVTRPSLLTIAFANAVGDREDELREWYATRHIRHALLIPALVSGQCFVRTQFQNPGSLDPDYSMIAIYEQEGTPEEMRRTFETLPPGALDFPAMDLTRLAEWVYRPCVPT